VFLFSVKRQFFSKREDNKNEEDKGDEKNGNSNSFNLFTLSLICTGIFFFGKTFTI